MSHRQTPKCLNCALVNEVDRQLLVFPRAGRALPAALLFGLPRVRGTLQVRSPSFLCPSLASALSFTFVPNSTVPALEGMEPILRSTQELEVGCSHCWPGAVQTGRWGWQLASRSRPRAGQRLEIHMCKGGPRQGGRWERQRQQAGGPGLEGSTGPQAVFRCFWDSGHAYCTPTVCVHQGEGSHSPDPV